MRFKFKINDSVFYYNKGFLHGKISKIIISEIGTNYTVKDKNHNQEDCLEEAISFNMKEIKDLELKKLEDIHDKEVKRLNEEYKQCKFQMTQM